MQLINQVKQRKKKQTNKQTSNTKQTDQPTNKQTTWCWVLVDKLITYQAMTTIQCFMESDYLLAFFTKQE